MFKVLLSNWITKPLKTRFSGLPEEVERILGNYHKPASLFLSFWFVRLKIKQLWFSSSKYKLKTSLSTNTVMVLDNSSISLQSHTLLNIKNSVNSRLIILNKNHTYCCTIVKAG